MAVGALCIRRVFLLLHPNASCRIKQLFITQFASRYSTCGLVVLWRGYRRLPVFSVGFRRVDGLFPANIQQGRSRFLSSGDISDRDSQMSKESNIFPCKRYQKRKSGFNFWEG